MESVGITQGASMLYYHMYYYMWVDLKEKHHAGRCGCRPDDAY